ncbi:MAG: sulfatase-like hydrolase/transferase [Lentisphaerales bacterium]|nr:sulfatase-like hydrolase/transferase [Lentisphaerales bacterium]
MSPQIKAFFFILCFWATCSLKAEKPNILFILLDDLGKEWVSTYGAQEINTPVIDNLAKTGMAFSRFYSMPQCTPTRITFMTGQYPFRHGWVNHWDVPRWGGGCHFDWEKNPSIARVMQSAGYKTAVAGKWQVNDFRVQPEAMVHHGFDDYCMWTGYEAGVKASAQRYWDPYIHTKEGSKTYSGKFGEDIFADFLIDFMKQNKENPMFMYYAMCLPHGPLVATPNEPDVKDKMAKHKAMVRYSDFIIGKLTKALDEMKLREKTIVIVTTDNGTTGSISGNRDGRMVKGGKMKTTENGINGPFVVNAPGLVPGGKMNHTLCDVSDLLPTFAELGGATLPKDHIFDGISFADVLLGKAEKGPRTWNMSMGGGNHAKRTEKGIQNRWYYRDRVISDGKYKLWISPAKKPVKLVDLTKDLYEKENLINNPEYAEIVKTLFAAVKNNFEKDNEPIYNPLKEEKWDVAIKAKADEWKVGKPGDEINFKPDAQGTGDKKKSKKK